MKLIPIDRFALYSKSGAAEVAARLQQHVTSIPPLRFSLPKERYEGTVSISEFKIARIVKLGETFNPIIEGKVAPEGGGALIEIMLRPPFFVSILFAGVGVISAIIIAYFIFSGVSGDLSFWKGGALAGFAAVILPPVMCALGINDFWRGARNTKHELMKILDATDHPSL